ncbi:MAG: ubiquinol-cytochrome C chaperone [Acetobacteraceae bacterium]|nr:ubiquinol-cytochrome C chaperone [Acetobacteraceae bacterium]
MGFLGRSRYERSGFLLYGEAVKAARHPHFYAELGAPDTLDGRFDLIGLHAFLLIERLRHDAEPGPLLAQAVFDAMFSDMDINLRELGVGDLSVGKRVRAMWEAFHGRSAAYGAALRDADAPGLEAALARNVWRGVEPPAGAPTALGAHARKLFAHLKELPLRALAEGRVAFPPPARDSR